jgi:hypothetical protein
MIKRHESYVYCAAKFAAAIAWQTRMGVKYSDGEDPAESHATHTANWATLLGIDVISRFRQLRFLEIDSAPLNGRYPFLFNFPLLQKLSISCTYLKWDLGILGRLPFLAELKCGGNPRLSGNIDSLRVFRDTLLYVLRATSWIWPTFHV